MTAISKVSSNENTQSGSGVITQKSGFVTKAAVGEFDSLLKSLLSPDGENKISEEELFAALAHERVAALKGDEAASKYNDILAAKKSAFARADGFIPVEKAANAALQELVSSGVLTSEEGDQVYSESFAGAQLDSNTEALFDSRGGANDPSRAVEAMEAALSGAKLAIDGFVAGTSTYSTRSLAAAGDGLSLGTISTKTGDLSGVDTSTETPVGNTVDGADGFLFKPISNNQGTLAVLLPESMAHLVEQVLLKDINDNVLDEGKSTGYGDTGEREKFSFSKKGGEYPKDIKVEVHMADGSIKTYEIPDPSQRYD